MSVGKGSLIRAQQTGAVKTEEIQEEVKETVIKPAAKRGRKQKEMVSHIQCELPVYLL